MWHKPCRTFHPWCLCIKTRCLLHDVGRISGFSCNSIVTHADHHPLPEVSPDSAHNRRPSFRVQPAPGTLQHQCPQTLPSPALHVQPIVPCPWCCWLVLHESPLRPDPILGGLCLPPLVGLWPTLGLIQHGWVACTGSDSPPSNCRVGPMSEAGVIQYSQHLSHVLTLVQFTPLVKIAFVHIY